MWKQETPLLTSGSIACISDLDVVISPANFSLVQELCAVFPEHPLALECSANIPWLSQISPCGNFDWPVFPIKGQDTLEDMVFDLAEHGKQ